MGEIICTKRTIVTTVSKGETLSSVLSGTPQLYRQWNIITVQRMKHYHLYRELNATICTVSQTVSSVQIETSAQSETLSPVQSETSIPLYSETISSVHGGTLLSVQEWNITIYVQWVKQNQSVQSEAPSTQRVKHHICTDSETLSVLRVKYYHLYRRK